MRVLILTSSGGTAHDAAAYALEQWLPRWQPDCQVVVDKALENSGPFYRALVAFYNWIQTHQPWVHQLFWRLIEGEDLIKPGTVLIGRRYFVALLQRTRPDLLISTHPHLNRGHFDLARRVLGPGLRCITCCTEVEGGFGFSRNWVSRRADRFWAITAEVAQEVVRRRYPRQQLLVAGPLLYPAFHEVTPAPAEWQGPPRLVLGTGGNGANNHQALLEQLLPFAGRLEVVALCGRRPEVVEQLQAWSRRHPQLALQALGFQDPAQMAALYRSSWAMVTRPGARTATEALLLGCPLIFNHYGLTMPQELLAPRYFAARGLEASIHQPQELAQLVGDLLEDPERYGAWRQRYQQHRLQSDLPAIRQALLGD